MTVIEKIFLAKTIGTKANFPSTHYTLLLCYLNPTPTCAMEMEGLFGLLSSIHPLTPAFREAIEKKLTGLSLPKDYMLLEAPRVADHAYYLTTGFAMTYSFVNGEKQIDGFWRAGQIMFSARSLFEQTPSREYIQLVQQSDVLCVSYSSIMSLFETFPEANFIYRVVMNQYYEHARERIRDLQLLSAVDRHTKLLRDYHGIEQLLPQEYIASYLGITPQSLSRIRRLHDS